MIRETHSVEYENIFGETMGSVSFEGTIDDIMAVKNYVDIITEMKQEDDDCCGCCCNECNCNAKSGDEIADMLKAVIDAEEMLFNYNEEYIDDEEDEDDDCEEDLVNRPLHYTNHGLECILEMVLLYGFEETMSFCKLNSHKYRKRALDKGGRIDLDKSDWYVNEYKELNRALEMGITPLQYVLHKTGELGKEIM